VKRLGHPRERVMRARKDFKDEKDEGEKDDETIEVA
jgi:hypothetical protein